MSSSVTLTCKTFKESDPNFTLTVSNMSSLANAYYNTVKKNNVYIPNKLNVVYYGDFVIICPNYQFGKNRTVPGNGGFKPASDGIIVKITVTSTEFPISIINNNYVVILSKTEYTPKIVDTEKIYLSKVSLTPILISEREGYIDLNFIMSAGYYYKYPNIEANHDIVEISDIYDNTAYTIANICNKLAEINRTFSFDVLSGTSFTFHYSINFKEPTYIPILFTMNNKYKNMFTKDYLDRSFYYYSNTFKWNHSTFSQTIDFTTTADTVTIKMRTYFADGSKDNRDVVFSPSKSPYTLYCSATDDLPQTFVGKSVKVDCPSGYSGYHEYKCEKEGVWENIYSNCQQIACEAADNFTRTIAGQTATKNCPTGYTGSITRRCSESGIWEDEVNSCILNNNESSMSESISEPSKNESVSESSKNESISESSKNESVSEPSKNESISESSESENNNYIIYIILIIIVVIIVIIIIIIVRVKSQSKKEINRFRLK